MMFTLAAVSAESMLSISVGAAAVGILYALHHLRVQPVRQPVATLIFWKQAARKQQARVNWAPRLTRFWTFLLLSLIGITIALSLSADRWMTRRNHSEKNAIVIDTGASMTAASGTNAQTLLSGSIQDAMKDLAAMPDTPAVISAGTQPVLWVHPGDPLAIAKRRLASLASSSSGSASALALNLAGQVIGTGDGVIYWYTDRDAIPAGVATAIARRVKIMRQPLPAESVSIIGADFVTSSGNEMSGTLLVRVSGRSVKSFTVEAQLSNDNIQEQPVNLVNQEADVSFQNVQANGQTLTLRIKGAPGPVAEQAMKFQLPLRAPLRFEFIGSIPSPLRLALLAIGSETTASDADVVVVQQGQLIPANSRAVIEVVEQGPAFIGGVLQVKNGFSQLAGLSFEDAGVEGGAEVPSTSQPLLQVGNSVVAGLLNSSGRKTLYLSQSIVDEKSVVPRRAAFPVFLRALSTSLAGWSQTPATVTSLRQIVDPLWNSSGVAGSVTNTVFESPQLAGISEIPAHDAALIHSTFVLSTIGWNEIILAFALLLLIIEGFLYAAKKIV